MATNPAQQQLSLRHNVPGTVYVLHFEPAYKHARHYIGWTAGDDISARLRVHLNGRGSPLVRAAVAAGVDVQLAALAAEPEQPVVLGSRAILHYEAGRLPQALADLDAAVRLAPDLGELYQNRAVALRELGRPDDAARDLSTYLELCPDAEDRDEVESSLTLLAGAR